MILAGSFLRDARGLRVTGATPAALALYDRAVAALQLQRGDALAQARAAQAEAPAFVAAHQLEAWLQLSSRDVREVETAGWAYARARSLGGNERERAHSVAIANAIENSLPGAVERLDAILAAEPRDAVALLVAHVLDYYMGNAHALRARSARVLPFWSEGVPGYHSVLSLHAFALQETGDYAEAEATARRALELEPADLRAHHAVTHVLEMQGRAEEGLRWMGSRSAYWAAAGADARHLWWHLALHQLELGRERLALEVYDRRIQGESLSSLIDASALLWRMHLAGTDLGGRFKALAARWAPHAEDAYCAFNDLHAMMAFVGGGRRESAERLIGALERRVEQPGGANHDMTRLVGLPAVRALAAYGRGDFAVAEAILRALPPVAHRIGGSHAQRDVLQLTRAAAAARRSLRKAA